MLKNAIPYRLTEDSTKPDLQSLLGKMQNKPLGNHYESNCGWSAPNEEYPDILFQEVIPGISFIQLTINEKIMPASVINEAVKKYVKKIEAEENRKPSKKERNDAKDEIIFEMLPKAFIKSTQVNAYIDYGNKLIIVDAASRVKAELLLSYLRKTLGSLPCVPLVSKNKISPVLNEYVRGQSIPAPIMLTDQFFIKDGEGEKQSRLSGFSNMSEVEELLNSGGMIESASLQWKNDLHFKLTSDFHIKAIKDLSDAEDDYDDLTEKFNQESVMTCTVIKAVIDDLLVCFGGENK